MSEPYERQQGETAKAFEAFVCYRDMGPRRTVVAVGKALAKSRQLVDRWAQRFDWEERAVAYDEHMDAERRKFNERDKLEELRQFRDRQRRLSAAASETAVRMLQHANAGLGATDGKLLKPATIAQFTRAAAAVADAATNSEALVIGVADLIEQMSANGDGTGSGA